MKLPGLGNTRRASGRPSSANVYRTEITADVTVPERAETVRFFSRKMVHRGKLPAFANKDLRESLLSLFYFGVAAFLPVGWWSPLCGWVSTLRRKRHIGKEFPRYEASVKAVLGDAADTQGLFRAYLAATHRRRLMLTAHFVSDWRWSPVIRLEGLDGLEQALRRGRGAIIWCDQFASQTIMGKRALHEAGVEAHQVSVTYHGFSESGFGLRFLNPPMIRTENRFLKSRIVFDRGDAYQVTSRIQNILKENGVVLMTNTLYAGSAFAEVAMGERGWTHLASTPANFAARAGAALFSMATFETVPFREYRAVVSAEMNAEEPLPARPKGVSSKNLALQARYMLLKRDHLLEALRLHPQEMMTWSGTERLTGRLPASQAGDGHVSG